MIRRFLVITLACGVALNLTGCSGPSEAEMLASAKALLDKRDTKGAIIQLKSALQKNLDLAEARLLLGQTLLQEGEPVGALVELRKAQELQVPDERVIPAIANAMLMVGEEVKLVAQYGNVQLKGSEPAAELKSALAAAYASQGDFEKARVTAEEALRLKPGYAKALLVLAGVMAKSDDPEGALALLDQTLVSDPGFERAALMKAELLLQFKRDAEGAQAVLRDFLAKSPGSVAARATLANVLFKLGRYDDARTELAQMKKSSPNHPETFFLDAQFAFADKDFKRARELADQVLKTFPNSVPMLELSGSAELLMRQYVPAEAMLARALKAAPGLRRPRLLLAQTYLGSGQPGKAIEVLQPLISVSRPDGTALAIVGEAYLQLGDARKSEDAFARAVKAAPSDQQVRTTAAMAQIVRGGNSGVAIADLETAAAGGGGLRADLALVAARMSQNDIPGAMKAIDALQKKMPDSPLPLHLRARVLQLTKDAPGARRAYEAALAINPAYFPSAAGIAALDWEADKPDDARKRFQAFIQEHPKNWYAHMALAELEERVGAKPEVVVAALREAVKSNASEPQPHVMLVNTLLSDGDTSGALLAAQNAAAALPNNLEVLDALGRAELASGDQQRAITTFRKLVDLQPTNALFELRLADAYMAMKNSDAAARSLRRAAQLQPKNVAAQRGLATLAMADNKPQNALTAAREIQKNNPTEAAGFVLEGDIESSRKNWDASAGAYRTALKIDRTAGTTARLHTALRAAGKSADADRLAAEWGRDKPKDAAFNYTLGDLALDRQDWTAGEAHFRAVLAVQPENAFALNNIAWLLVKQGKPGAVAIAEKANKLLPDTAPIIDTLSMALDAENQVPQAIDAQKRALALQPKDPNFKLRLAKLYIKAGDKTSARYELDALARLGDRFVAHEEVTALMKAL